ncbi:MAG: winged helix-turn-helix transcriptional regulator [Clostridia bacterium]|nr:winged helix-turn-helix transcriptional regulator [Clostridia bacterium]
MQQNFECKVDVVHQEKLNIAAKNMPSEERLYDVAELFKVFGDSTRTKIISALFSNELCVCDIAKLLNMTKSAVSHQLRILRTSKLVKARKSGKEVFYSLSDNHVIEIYKFALEHVEE